MGDARRARENEKLKRRIKEEGVRKVGGIRITHIVERCPLKRAGKQKEKRTTVCMRLLQHETAFVTTALYLLGVHHACDKLLRHSAEL